MRVASSERLNFDIVEQRVEGETKIEIGTQVEDRVGGHREMQYVLCLLLQPGRTQWHS